MRVNSNIFKVISFLINHESLFLAKLFICLLVFIGDSHTIREYQTSREDNILLYNILDRYGPEFSLPSLLGNGKLLFLVKYLFKGITSDNLF